MGSRLNLRISKEKAKAILLIFPFLEPDSFRIIYSFHMFLRIWGMLSLGILLLFFFTAHRGRRKTLTVFLLMIYLGWVIYASTTGLGSLTTTLTQLLPIIGISLWADYYIVEPDTFSVAINLIMLYIYINLVTLFLFPNGLYVSQSYQATPYVCYFLGYRNVQSLWLIPALSLTLWDNYRKSKKLDRKSMFRILAILLTTLIIKSSTTYVATACFVIFFILLVKASGKKYLWGAINIWNAYIVYVLLTIGLVFFDVQYNFSYLIENILHKDLDLTDRVYIWQKVLVYISNQFMMGYGYIYDPTSRALIGASHPHNYLLNLLYTGGIVGTLLITGIFFLTSRKSTEYMNSMAVRSVFLGVVVLLLIGLTEPLKQLPTLYLLLFMLYHSENFV